MFVYQGHPVKSRSLERRRSSMRGLYHRVLHVQFSQLAVRIIINDVLTYLLTYLQQWSGSVYGRHHTQSDVKWTSSTFAQTKSFQQLRTHQRSLEMPVAV